jgi:hypothetical protein
MSDEETRSRRSQQRKKNIYAKILRDQNDFKGAFSLKIIDKPHYKREKLNPRNIPESEEEYD